MSKEIFILCNSAECLKEISSGKYPDLQTKDLFTCNNAFTFFRTSGKHFNMMVDGNDIYRFTERPENLFREYHQKIYFIFSEFEKPQIIVDHYERDISFSPIKIGCSSAIAALFYLNAVLNYDVIRLIGYTLIEDHEGTPAEKKNEFQKLYNNYFQEKVSDHVFRFTRKIG